MLLHMRTMLLVLALSAALAAGAFAQAPPGGPPPASTTQGTTDERPQPVNVPPATRPGAVVRPTTQPATTQPGTTQPTPPVPPATRVTKGTPMKETPATSAVRPPPTAPAPIQKPAVITTPPAGAKHEPAPGGEQPAPPSEPVASHAETTLDFWSMVFVFMLATFIGLGVIRRVSRLLHTPLMSLTNAISAIAVVGSIVLAGSQHYPNNWYHFWGAVALFASMTNIVSGFLITDRMLKMFKTREVGK